ncbi:PhzF family phenazine biosynthesis protein [Erysipelothrix inopinata]|uniref:PhzF family phenazine biosynthesis protein n=1 Tax=Erysipelothrix inopinata TaxID=225084 RepID=A0A7G9S118_9FIRM|nr:PhzF family phenazine biosynthesis protein [Erysipelothrix inopinata]QNN61543.1 PhzF family phenazine biosynthesis protein [Erysipelothrix inopinata]
MKLDVYVASAFSKNHSGGNRAGVVFLKAPLSRDQKMYVAKKLGYAETAFVSESKKADYKLEFFTPKEEVPLCGHATIGTFAILMYLNQVEDKDYIIETKSGILSVQIKNGLVLMQQNAPEFYEQMDTDELGQCFSTSAIVVEKPIQIVSTGLKDILVPIKDKKALDQIKPNFEAIKKVSDKYSVIGMHLFTISGKEIYCRNFAPLYDINEESATGTSNAALACYLYTQNKDNRKNFVFNQGQSLNSPSEIIVELDADDELIHKVYVGGKGYFHELIEMEV